MQEIKRMSIKEFRKFGFLQEANRQFFHPLGLALEVVINYGTGEEHLGGIWDYRDDPEGIRYEGFDDADRGKAQRVRELQEAKAQTRLTALGYVVQPIPEPEDEVE